MILEIISQTYAETYGAVITEVARTHLVVNSGFYREIVIEIERIAQLHRNENIVAAFREMGELSSSSQIETILRDVVAQTATGIKVINSPRVLITHIGIYHPTISKIITCIELQTKAESVSLAIGETEV